MNLIVGMIAMFVPIAIWYFITKAACGSAVDPMIKGLQESLETLELQLRDLQRSNVRIREEMQGNYRAEKETK